MSLPPSIAKLRSRLLQEPYLSLWIITAIALLSYAIPIFRIGYYWDDWYFGWLWHSQGARGIYDELRQERPFSGMLFVLNFAWLGNHVLLWHVYMFGVRLAGAFSFLWLGRGVWNKQPLAALFMTLLFVTYPGFWGQPYALAMQNYLIALLLGVLSLAMTVHSIRRNNIMWTIPALVTGLGCLLILEGFIGLEALRLLLLIYVLRGDSTKALLAKVGKRWLPYLIALLGFLIWRSLIYQPQRPDVQLSGILDLYIDNPIGRLQFVTFEVIRDFMRVVGHAWGQAWFTQSDPHPTAPRLWYFCLSLLAMAILVMYWRYTKQAQENDSNWTQPTALLGLVATPLLIFPIVFVLKDIDIGTRYTLPASVGASILVVGLAYHLLPGRFAQSFLIFLIGLSVYTQMNINRTYQIGWEHQRAVWWQLAWRAPQLAPGTVIVLDADYEWDAFYRDYEVSAPANFIYAYASRQNRVNGTRLDSEDLPYMQSASWHGDTNYANALVLFIRDRDSCLRVLDNTRPHEIPAAADDLTRAAASYSSPSLILTNEGEAVPSEMIFGDEPPHEWCYYLQKAELARQLEDWTTVAAFADTVRQRNFAPGDALEWLPFLDGYLYTDQIDKARQVITDAMPNAYDGICAALERFESMRGDSDYTLTRDLLNTAQCFDLHLVWNDFIDPGERALFPSNVVLLPILNRTRLPGFVTPDDLSPEGQARFDEWVISRSPDTLLNAGISYVVIDDVWELYDTPEQLALIADSPGYTLLHEWRHPLTEQRYKLYRVNPTNAPDVTDSGRRED